MKNPILLKFTLRDLIIGFFMFIVMIVLMTAKEVFTVHSWKFWSMEVFSVIALIAVMIYTDSKVGD